MMMRVRTMTRDVDKMKIFDSTWKTAAAWIVILTIFLIMCAKKEKGGEILAVVGDRKITADEFMRRAEFTVRPAYCRQNSGTDKTIILNSLIAEKLAAFESGEDNALARNPSFKAYIRGRKEQMMRNVLFGRIAADKIRPDTSELNTRYRMAGREYHVAYCTIGGDLVRFAEEQETISGAGLFDAVYRKAGGLGPPPERTVSWESEENPAVHRALFSEVLVRDQVIGPVQVDEEQFLMLKVLGWVDRPAVTDSGVRQRNDDVVEAWEREKAEAVWDNYVYDLMKNKRLDFDPDMFGKMAALFRPMVMRPRPNALPFMNQNKLPEMQQAVIDSVRREMNKQEFEGGPFFTFDGKTWTVADFLEIYASHPLVFRKSKFSESEFPEQFKFAVADLMRDQIINREAYAKGIDRLPSVQAYEHMWQDALMAKYQQYMYLQSRNTAMPSANASPADIERILDDYLNPYTDSLFVQYSDRIRINMPVFESIRLTRIDMVALNRNVPYPETVPSFPMLTNKSRLNFGTRVE
ncbi:hypothetical protein JW948_04405 [bacterium]|nr:hypothetical protein [bacterium]